ncbi:cyclin-dependent protein kinase inhibitor [Crepidotus variabilis]|uniref:Peroxisome assembly protein 12 n=1 Tax=Crepidotus variabilis TaxID=179855 RepID=A0A9P6EU83_9AGAR|nr:cyclin-dependent protein kinase inhibitor [Crepidotus variabilis]
MEFFNDTGPDPLRPSLFELVAQEQLRDLLQPALKYVLAVFAQRYPRYLIKVVNRHEEFYAFIMLIVERHYLRKHNASFSENFYGLKRRRRPFIEPERATAAVGGIPPGERLRKPEIWRSLLFLVGVPYLRAKAQDYYEELGGGVSLDILEEGLDARQIQALTDESYKGRLRRAFKAVYPYANTAFELWLLVWNMAYLFDRTPSYRPWLHWIGIDIRRLGMEDFVTASLASQQKLSPNAQQKLSTRLRQLLLSSPRLLLDSLRLLLPTAIFFVKFLEWWYSPGSPARSLSTSPKGPAIPPPSMLPPHPQGIFFDREAYGICPICKKSINNATALPSGYVFCYRCAYEQVEQNKMCPVTLLPARTWQLRKVLTNDRSRVRNNLQLRTQHLFVFFSWLYFGKQIQAQQVPGWSGYYLDYKFLKKIISSLAANRPASEAAALALGTTRRSPAQSPAASPGQPPIFAASGNDLERGPDFRAHKAAFFFKLERELEKINAFYLQKEAEVTLRMEDLLSKRRGAAKRGIPDMNGDTAQDNVEWSAVEEGFRLLERDLSKLQAGQFVEINAIGFRKILKKFDKRATSTTKELYLTRQVDVQPVFNRQLISELADTVATCLLNITDLSAGLKFEGPAANDIFTQQILAEVAIPSGPFRDLERNFRKALETNDSAAILDCVHYSDLVAQQSGGKANVTRILWNIIIEAPPELADLILASLTSPFDYHFVDDINSRTHLHEASIAGTPRMISLCIQNHVSVDKCDLYGRTALHYAAMKGHSSICDQLLDAGASPNTLDRDNYSPLVYTTLKGDVASARILLEKGKVPAQPSTPTGDFSPLSLAAQAGHTDVVVLLLDYGAVSTPNNNGEYPIHLAAREGHAAICELLLRLEGWDVPDKYHEWTPIFHAARYGRTKCVRILVNGGCRASTRDELGHNAAHYAAWYGHHESLGQLLHATADQPTPIIQPTATRSPMSALLFPSSGNEMEIDAIPSLSLPPPIMPHRVYGHNYLVHTHLVQMSVGHSTKRANHSTGVRIHHRLISPFFKGEYILSTAPLKLVLTAGPQVDSVPYTISLPQHGDEGTFAFQVADIDKLTLEFSLYPNFGTKTIGRATALPSLFKHVENHQLFTLPLVDHRLHIIGEVDFEINLVTSFKGVTLEVGGDLETYWKSTAVTTSLPPVPSRVLRRPNHVGSVQVSPSQATSNSGGQTVTISSLNGDYVYVVVQVTRDLQPVVYFDWLLPEVPLDVGVADGTLSQFEALAKSSGRNILGADHKAPAAWGAALSRCMITLDELMRTLPIDVNLVFDIAFPSNETRSSIKLTRQDLNSVVDAVLKKIFEVNDALETQFLRRKITFLSFSPDICSALNWKQPNYPVFLGTICGKDSEIHLSHTSLGSGRGDERVLSVGAAVEFAKANNLLGLFVNSELLVQVPSLIEGIRGAELLVGVYGAAQAQALLRGNSHPDSDSSTVDASICDSVVNFVDRSMRELV